MKLSNTMIMNETLLPSNKKAFTLAEVLITLSILGVVAALTIPSLVNRQSEMAAIVKLKKAISTYESVAEVYMAEEEATNLSGLGANSCALLAERFKIVNGSGCTFTTADGVLWKFDGNGYALAFDSVKAPRYGVAMWAENGLVNSTQTGTFGSGAPTASIAPPSGAIGGDTFAAPAHGYFSAADMLKIDKSKKFDSTETKKSVAQAMGLETSSPTQPNSPSVSSPSP